MTELKTLEVFHATSENPACSMSVINMCFNCVSVRFFAMKVTEGNTQVRSGSLVGHRFPSADEAALHLKPFVWSRQQDLVTSTKSKFNYTEGIDPKDIEDSDVLAVTTTSRNFHSSLVGFRSILALAA